jgi:hypothetical protein
MGKWFAKLTLNQKCLFFMGALALVVFAFLCPLFFFHSENNYPLGAYPLGWLLGSGAEILAFLTLMYMSDTLFAQKDPNHMITSTLALASSSLRFVLYAAVLLVSGICTFKSEWFGGFNAFNFYTTAAGLLPMLFVVLFTTFFNLKHNGSAPQGSAAPKDEKNPGDQK